MVFIEPMHHNKPNITYILKAAQMKWYEKIEENTDFRFSWSSLSRENYFLFQMQESTSLGNISNNALPNNDSTLTSPEDGPQTPANPDDMSTQDNAFVSVVKVDSGSSVSIVQVDSPTENTDNTNMDSSKPNNNQGELTAGLVGHLIHWGRVTHVCVSNLAIIGSDNK